MQVAFLMGLSVKSAFALLLTRVTEPRMSKFMRLEVYIMQRTISAMVGKGSVKIITAANSRQKMLTVSVVILTLITVTNR